MVPNAKKHIAILGSTGSIGTQALDVIREHPQHFEVEVLTAGSNADLLIKQSLEFLPNAVVIGDKAKYAQVRDALFDRGVKVYAGEQSLREVVEMAGIDLVLTALVGYSGLRPTLSAIQAGKAIALANKETLVVAGDLITAAAKKAGVPILPVDSEHSAIFQCLSGESHNPIEKIILTASGGPFRGYTAQQLNSVTLQQALKHPNWDMGAKITIDSASLMNKGLEVIEARWLFNLPADQIEVLIHPQSIIHSMVQFEDGSIKAQMGLPDMKLPILYALGYPRRIPTSWPRCSFEKYAALTFEQPDLKTFKNLGLAYAALEQGGNSPCVLNAANEIAVQAFIEGKIRFIELPELVEVTLEKVPYIPQPSLDDYMESDSEARRVARSSIQSFARA